MSGRQTAHEDTKFTETMAGQDSERVAVRVLETLYNACLLNGKEQTKFNIYDV